VRKSKELEDEMQRMGEKKSRKKPKGEQASCHSLARELIGGKRLEGASCWWQEGKKM